MMRLAKDRFTFSLRGGLVLASEIVAFSALGGSLAWMMWTLVEPVGATSTGISISQASAPFDDIAIRLSRIPEAALKAQTDTPQISTDGTGFALYGARAGNGGGTAIIAVNGAPQAAFSVGEEIVPGARLAKVASDHVEINANDRMLYITFVGAPAIAPPPLAAPPTSAQASIDNTNPLVNSLSLRAVARGDGKSGFEITSEAALSALGGYELRAGDIVLKINGVDVSPGNLASLASDLQAGRSLDIAYERNGQINTTRLKRAGK